MIADLYLRSSSPAPKLRIGLMVEGDQLSAAAAAVVAQVKACDFAEIVLVVRNGGVHPVACPRPPLPVRLLNVLTHRHLRRRFAYAAYTQLDAALSRVADPLQMVEAGGLLAGIESLTVQPLEAGFVQRFPAEAVAAVRARDLDVLIRFGFNILKGEILSAARCGVWSYHHGDPDFYRGAPPQFWEMAEGNPLSGVVLQILNEELDGGLVLEKGLFATDLGVSLLRNRAQVFWGSVHFVVARLKCLHAHGPDGLKARALPGRPYGGRRRLYVTPDNGELLRWLLPTVAGKVAKRLRPKRIEHWQIALRVDDGSGPAVRPEEGRADLSGFRFIAAPQGRFYADPVLFTHQGRTVLFFEDGAYAGGPAVISCAPVEGGGIGPATVCLDIGSHLSFPHVFADGDDIYMMPESREAGEVALYRATSFPTRWEKAHVLHAGPAVDSVLRRENGVWYLFTTLMSPGIEAMSLHLFTADTLAGPWRLHPASPICEDVRRSRCAGPLVERGGRLYRPAQDCSGTYGRAVSFNRVETLTPDAYAERPVLELGPADVPAFAGTAATGLHAYDARDGIEAIDAKFPLPPRLVR